MPEWTFNFGDFRLTLMSIIFEALPFIVIGALVSGILEEMLPQQFFKRFLPRNPVLAIVMSSLLGILMPMCECGIVPVMRRLLRKGVPASCAITYMLSAPGMNFIVLSSTALAFWGYREGAYDFLGVGGSGMVLLRGGFAFITAVTIGIVIDRLARRGVDLVRKSSTKARLVETPESRRLIEESELIDSARKLQTHDHDHAHACNDPSHHHDHHHHHEHDHGPGCDHAHPAKRTVLDRIKAIAQIAMGDFIDISAFLVMGAVLAALISTSLPRATLESLAGNEPMAVAGMMMLAFFLSLCSEADAFVAANFTALSTGSKLAMIVFGPMLDVKLLIMYRWVFHRRTLLVMIPMMLVIIYVLCVGWDFLEPRLVSMSPGEVR